MLLRLAKLAVSLLVPAAALFVACSSTTVVPGATGDAGDSRDDAAPGDAGAEAARVPGCPGAAPARYAWRGPVTPVTSACSNTELTKLAGAIASKTLVVESDFLAALGPSCAACAIGHLADETWRAVVVGHDGYIGNVGGCAMLLGTNETCGKAVDQLSTCLIVGCDGCADRKAQDGCSDKLTTVDGACAAALTTLRKQCPAKILAAAFDTNGVCQSFVETIRLFCGLPATDGG